MTICRPFLLFLLTTNVLLFFLFVFIITYYPLLRFNFVQCLLGSSDPSSPVHQLRPLLNQHDAHRNTRYCIMRLALPLLHLGWTQSLSFNRDGLCAYGIIGSLGPSLLRKVGRPLLAVIIRPVRAHRHHFRDVL